jgi:integrase
MVLRRDQEPAEKPNRGAGKTRGRRALTHRSIEALRPEVAPYRVKDAKCSGLAIRVASSGAMTWDLAFRIKGAHNKEGKPIVKRVSLGRFPGVSLDAARQRADALTRAGRAGEDLLQQEDAAKAAARARITVEKLIDDYVLRRVTGRSLRTAREIESRLRRALAPLLERVADDIRRRDIRELLDAVSDAGMKREADKRRVTVASMFRWAVSQELVTTDPTTGLSGYESGVTIDRTLSSDEIATLWTWLPASNLSSDCQDILRLELALGARCGEIAGIVAEEIDGAKWLWTLPAARSKNGKTRATPLVGVAREILGAKLGTVNKGLLFPTGTGKAQTSSNIGHMLARQQNKMPLAAFTTHDLRRSTATLMVELGVPLDVVAAIIGHEAGSRDTRTLVRHYVRTDLIERKRAALEVWDRHLIALFEGTAESNVTQIAAHKRAV